MIAMTNPTTVEQARKTVTELSAKRDETETKKLGLEAVRDACAYAAHTGDKKARAKLTETLSELVKLDGELASFDAAIRTANLKVNEALGFERATVEREHAEQARKIARHILDAGKSADVALKQAFAALHEIREAGFTLSRIGYGPNGTLIESNLRRAIVTASLGTRFSLGALAPSEQHSVVELAER